MVENVTPVRKPTQLKNEVAAYKRRRIVEEASRLFFDNGYEATTLDAVAEQLHVTKPFIYSYYRNKSELLSEICQTGIQLSLTALEDALAIDGAATEQLKTVVERVAADHHRDPELHRVYQREEKALDRRDAHRILRAAPPLRPPAHPAARARQTLGEFEFEDAGMDLGLDRRPDQLDPRLVHEGGAGRRPK